ncbi:hypothetical protein KC19_2G124800 [Ceratodon purpureus]|uniref:Peroxidase n=2 Tax=Ceratodon purpureus TaxID=3225 RepID=A0A8T0IT38_CERPU|nr:hypothetical protein KC19_2G124800 [Ceratodon purpureus]
MAKRPQTGCRPTFTQRVARGPEYEKITYNYVTKLYNSPKNNTVVSMIRWAFHDFVNGADASFLLRSDNFPNNQSEKDSISQVGMRNSKYVGDIKLAVDAYCPGVISCADTLAVAGAAAVKVMGGPYIPIKVGRRDSCISLKSSADKIPRSTATVDQLLAFFKPLGMNTAGAVAMMGGHSVGRAHCVSFKARLYPKLDPKLDLKFAKKLLNRCPTKIPLNSGFNPIHFTYIRNDPFSPLTLDNHYFQELLKRHGVMKVDDNLIWDARTLPYVKLFAKDAKVWKKTFLLTYQKLSEYKVLTGKQGEIRWKCSLLNKK